MDIELYNVIKSACENSNGEPDECIWMIGQDDNGDYIAVQHFIDIIVEMEGLTFKCLVQGNREVVDETGIGIWINDIATKYGL